MDVEPKIVSFFEKCHEWATGEQTSATQTYANGVWGQRPQPLDDFCNFSEKIAMFTPFETHFKSFFVI